MAELTVWQNGRERRVPFTGTPTLDEVLTGAGLTLPHPCGGRGQCRKCAVTLTGAVSAPNAAETAAGCRLSCQAVLLGDAAVTLPDTPQSMRIETETGEPLASACPMPGACGVAVDIGTTTLAVKLYDLADGRCIGTAAAGNPQTAVAADVMGRIGAALSGALPRLQTQVQDALAELCRRASAGRHIRPDSAVITGNTTMLYLLTGRDPSCLSCAPFIADTRFDTLCTAGGVTAYLPPCMDAFVGADITCAVLASGIIDRPDTALLCDIGTNGELALWHEGRLYVTSTAAGPAFEGAGISCGCGSVSGAIDRVRAENGRLEIHTIDDAPAVGVCGSGLIDAVAAALSLGWIDGTGAVDDDLPLAPGVSLTQADIRAVQVAKAAIAAGTDILLETAGITADRVTDLAIAGGFGSHLSVASAAAIGLLPESPAAHARVLGNAALTGAARVLLDTRQQEALRAVAAAAVPVHLGGNPRFNERYIDRMLFSEE